VTVTLVKAVQTSSACPSQWDAWDANGQYYYLRYRHAHGTVHRYSGPEWSKDDMHEELRVLEATARATSYKVDEEVSRAAWDAYWKRYNELYLVASFSHGHPLDGYLELPEFCRLAGIELADTVDFTCYGRHLSREFQKALDEAKAERAAQGKSE